MSLCGILGGRGAGGLWLQKWFACVDQFHDDEFKMDFQLVSRDCFRFVFRVNAEWHQ